MAHNLNSLLKLLASHHDQILEKLKEIDGEKDRVSKLMEKRAEKATELEGFKIKHHELSLLTHKQENELEMLERNIEKAQKANEAATTQHEADASEKQLQTLRPKYESLTENSLESLEELERIQELIDETQEFLKGSEQTLLMLQNETQAHIKEFDQDREALEYEFQNELLPSLRKEFQGDVLSARKKSFFKRPFSALKGRSCGQCGQSLDSFQAKALEKGDELQLCAGCGRILFDPS